MLCRIKLLVTPNKGKSPVKKIIPILMSLTLFACQDSEQVATIKTEAEKVVVEEAKPVVNAPAGQLSKDIVPIEVFLDLTIVPDETYFHGKTNIVANINKPQKEYYIHGNLLEVEKVQIKGADNKTIDGTYEQVSDSGVALLRFPEIINTGKVDLEITYKSKFNEALDGLYRVNDGGLNYAFTQFEAIAARLAFPGFDEPAFKVPYTTSLTVKHEHVAIANTPVVKTTELENGMKRLDFQKSKPLPSYLIAFAVGEFDVVTWEDLPANKVRDRPVPLSGLATKGKGDKLAFALEHTQEILESLEFYFEIPYPYLKLDIIAVPDFGAGAMENAGAITYREQLLLLDDDSSPAAKRRYMGVHGHELAHQWFGNLVTPYWWNDIWLNEAFATWMSYTALHTVYPEQNFDQTILNGSLGAMGSDSLASARQIRQPIKSDHDISGAFDGITYSKGGGVLEMMNVFLTPEQFRSGIQSYMHDFAFKNASADDFIASISAASQNIPAELIKSSFSSFLEQPGIPYLNVESSCEDGVNTIALTQSRYFPLGSEGDTSQKWEIPACMSYEIDGKIHQDCHMINAPEQEFSLAGSGCAAYIMPNANGSGYYRYEVKQENWNNLFDNIDNLTDKEVISLNDSFSAAVQTGAVDFTTLMRFAPTIVTSEIRSIASAPMAMMKYMKEKVAETESDQLKLEKVANKLYQAQYQRLGFDPRNNDSEEDKKLRSSVITFIADTGKNKDVRAKLVEMANTYVGYGTDGQLHEDKVDTNLVGLALGVAVEDSEMKFTNHLIEILDKENDGTVRGRLLSAISANTDEEFTKEIRDWILSDKLRGNEIYGILFSQIGDKDKIDGMWQWTQDNFEAFKTRIPTWFQGRMPMIGSGFCDLEKKKELTDFFDPIIEGLSGGPRSLAQTEEGIDLCIAKLEHDKPMLKAYLDTIK